MGFTKETASKAGKKSTRKGVPNSVSADSKKFYKYLFENNQTKIETELEKLDGKDFIDAILKLSEYVVPKLSRQEQVIDDGNLTIEIVHTDGDI